MKIKTLLFALIGAGLILYGCTGSPATVDRYGNAQPDRYNPRDGAAHPDSMVFEFDSNAFKPAYNHDGTITVFSNKDFQIRILPMTNTRTRGASNKITDEFDVMIAKYESDLTENPNDYEACLILAGLYINRAGFDDFKKAVEYSNIVLAVYQNDPLALFARGVAYNAAGETVKALEDLEAVLRANIGDDSGICYLMGEIHYREGRLEEARKYFEAVKTKAPEFAGIDEILEELQKQL